VTAFTKVHGNGNDFVVLENLDARLSSDDLARFAGLLCRRNFSIGADGILVVESAVSTNADFAMRIFNSDGSEAEMCGNGARALARYAFEKGLAGSPMRFTTLAGLINATVDPPYVELDMGDIPLKKEATFESRLNSHGLAFAYILLTVGVPHCVLFVEDYDALGDDLKFDVGKEVSRGSSRFPEGCNFTFAQPFGGNEIRAVTYENGVNDLTKSCGTGCVAAAIATALHSEEKPGSAVGVFKVHNPGGTNDVRLEFAPDGSGCRAWLKGKTAIVAEGRVLDDAFCE
jgi:diaminopimelate epimerase